MEEGTMTTRNPLQKLALTSLVATLSAVPGLALAHGGGTPAPTLITVDNRFDADGQVFIDGRYAGTVGGDRRASFATSPGCHTVVVRRPSTNYTLASVNLTLGRGTDTLLPVHAPRGTLRVTNAGEVALKLRAEGATSVWVNPGGTVVMNVESGNVALKASIRDPRGDWDALERVAWVEPGRPEGMTLKPDPTVLVVTNHERYPVHALIDGKDIGWIDPGRSQQTWVRPGRADVVLLDRSGRVRTSTSVVLKKGQDTRVVLSPAAPARPGVVVTAQLPTVVVSAGTHGRGRGYGHDRDDDGHQRPGPSYRSDRDGDRGDWNHR
jgi:hypothetical protein